MVMAPANKRKRGDRTFSHDSNESGRPSPHRPQDMNTGGQNRQYNNNSNNRGARRGSRGGRGGGNQPPRSPATPSNHQMSTPTAMSPPPNPSFNKPIQPVQPAQQAPYQPSPNLNPVSLPDLNGLPFSYDYITEDRITSWHEDGKAIVVETAKKALTDDDFLGFNIIFQELVRAGLDGHLEAAEAGSTVKEILTDAAHGDAASQFLDALSVMIEGLEPIPPRLQSLLIATEIDPTKMRAELDVPVLTALGLVRNTFFRSTIRKTTNELYRQCAFNLLREESEGYSKLMTEYFQTVNQQPPKGPFVAETFEKVKALIGTFDLDVGRVLDVTLDVFASLLVKHHKFFIKFLRCSYWWPLHPTIEGVESEGQGFSSLPNWAEPGYENWYSTDDEKAEVNSLRESRDQKFWLRVKEVGIDAFFELGGRRIRKDRAQLKIINNESNETDGDTDAQWRRITGTLPPSGNHIAAQLLGFKLRFYASSARDANDILPDNLIYLAGLLIKIGFISVLDLYPHLYPPDEDMPAIMEKLMKEKAEREKKNRPGGGSMNALAMAGALVDDTLPHSVSRLRAEEARASTLRPDAMSDAAGTPGQKDEDEKSRLPDPVDQKYKLLQTLLLMGAIPESLFILGRHPWLLDVYPDLPEHVHRILHQCLSKVYEPLRPLSNKDSVRSPKKTAEEVSGLAKGQVDLKDGFSRRVLRWAQLDRIDAGDNGTDYKYYWDEWTDNVPVCQNIDDVFTLCGSLLNLTGVKIGRDPKLMIKLARIGKSSLRKDASEANKKRWQDLCKRLLVPALSLASGNPGVLNEVFELLQSFPTALRYNMYAEWFTGATSRLPDIATAFEQSKAETKDVLKRISKENVKQMARSLAKVANGSPGVVFQVTLNQIESYSNLIDVVIECAKYFTYLGYDVLTWSLLNSLGGRGRDRMQGDGMLTSQWLKALSTFTGRVFKYYANMDPTPVLQYITYQLRNGVSTDLEILEQMLEIMSGVRSEIEFNTPQVLAMAGSTTLRARTLAQVLDGRTKPETQVSAQRLIRSLVKPGLAAPLLISIAQERQVYVYRNDNKDVPLKVAANNLDKLHHIFIQYLDVLRHYLDVEEFDSIVPDIISLMAEFNIDAPIAWAISRDSLSKKINEHDAALKEKKDREEKERKTRPANHAKKSDEDVDMIDGETKSTATAEGEGSRWEEDEDMKDAPQLADAPTPSAASSDAADSSHPVLKEIAERLRPILSEGFEDRMSLSFYTRFWQLTLHDLHVPMEQNSAEIEKIKSQQAAIRADKSDVSTTGRDRKRRQITELSSEVDLLAAGAKSMLQVHTMTFSRLKQENRLWFSSLPFSNMASRHQAIIQDCFLPRILMSPYDSHYVFRMLLYLHNAGTPGFHTWTMIDQIFRDKLLTPLIFQFTSREASNMGRFLNDLLKELSKWHATREEYSRLAYGTKRDLPGLAKKINEETKKPEKFLDFDEFRQSLFKWHNNLRTALLACLKGGEYMHVRNAIIILRAMHENYPVVDFMGKTLIESVRDLTNESRGDLKLMAQSLVGLLSRRQKLWVIPQAFRPGSAVGSTGRSSSARPDTPQPGNSALNAAASEFKPGGKANGNGAKSGGVDDDSDGEIDETKAAAAKVAVNTSSSDETTSLNQRPIQNKSEAVKEEVADHAAPSTPSASGPQKPDGSRPPSQPAASRVQHALPSRPDGFSRGRPNERTADRPTDYRGHGTSTSQADSRRPPPNGEYGRLEQPGESYPYRDPRERSPGRPGRGRTPERDRRDPNWMGPRETPREHPDHRRMRPLPSPRDGHLDGRSPYVDSPRDARDRFAPDPRPPPSADAHRRLHGVGPAGSPASGYHGPNRDTPTGPHPQRPERTLPNPPPKFDRNADRAAQSVDLSTGVNPARAQMIEAEIRDKARDNFRGEHDSHRDRGSRPHSPRRDERMAPGPYPARGGEGPRGEYRDDRGPLPDRPHASTYSNAAHDRRDDPSGGPPPSGPRGERGMRELFQSSTNSRAAADPDHGRLNRDFTQPTRPNQDPNYGRLNSNADIPSGPRGPRPRQSRDQRSFPNAQSNSAQPPASPASDRVPPGSLDDRREQRPSGPADRAPATSSAPPTPITEQPPPTETSGVHPSRLNHIQTDLPPPIGPRGSQRTPGGPSPSTRVPPTGPAFSSDRERTARPDHRGEDKRFVGVQNILQQATSGGSFERGPSDRNSTSRGNGRPGRSSGIPSPGQPSTPISARPEHVQVPPSGRDLMAPKPQGETHSQDERSEGRGSRRDGRDSKSSRHRDRERSPRGEKEGSSRRERDDGRSEHRDKRPSTGADRPERAERPERPEGGRESSRRNGREEGREKDRASERGGEREREHRERREARGERDREIGGTHPAHQSSRNDARRPPLPPQAPPPGPPPNDAWQVDRNNDMRIRGEGHRRDSGDIRGGGERGGRKRGRGEEPGIGPAGGHQDKRPRRSQG